jgi:hypothetical protein
MKKIQNEHGQHDCASRDSRRGDTAPSRGPWLSPPVLGRRAVGPCGGPAELGADALLPETAAVRGGKRRFSVTVDEIEAAASPVVGIFGGRVDQEHAVTVVQIVFAGRDGLIAKGRKSVQQESLKRFSSSPTVCRTKDLDSFENIVTGKRVLVAVHLNLNAVVLAARQARTCRQKRRKKRARERERERARECGSVECKWPC